MSEEKTPKLSLREEPARLMCFLDKDRRCPDMLNGTVVERCTAFDESYGGCSITTYVKLAGRKQSFPVSAPPPEVRKR